MVAANRKVNAVPVTDMGAEVDLGKKRGCGVGLIGRWLWAAQW